MEPLSLVKNGVLTLTFLLLFVPSVVYLYPSLVGGDRAYIVLGGSMRPTFCPGDMIIVEEVSTDELAVGDLTTFKVGDKAVTHRLVKIEETEFGKIFAVKGDANEEIDGYVLDMDIIGKVQLIIPLRYLFSPYGYVLLLLAPATILVGKHVRKVLEEPVRGNRPRRRKFRLPFQSRWKRRSRRKPPILDTTSLLLTLIMVSSSVRLITPLIVGSSAYFSDVESAGSRFAVDTWRVPSRITCKLSNSTVNLGENVTISGSIDPARSAEVTIKISIDDGAWSTLTAVTSNADGSYHYQWEPGAGSYNILASWNGDEYYVGATSEEVAFTVLDATGG